MSRFKIRTAMIGTMALLAMGAFSIAARAEDPLKLESIDVQTLSGQQVQLKLHMSGPPPEPLPFTIDKPARIAFDLPNTTLWRRGASTCAPEASIRCLPPRPMAARAWSSTWTP
jgi:hypothetical protein